MQTPTVSGNTSGLVANDWRITNLDVGTPTNVTKRVIISDTHVSRYNHVVRNMNYLIQDTNEKKKWFMRGSHFFYVRFILVIALLACVASIITTIFYKKPMAAIGITISTVYILLSIYNIIIYRLNRPLLHPLLTIPVMNHRFPLNNQFLKVPLQTTLLNSALAALVTDAETYTATLQVQYVHRTHVTVMLYDIHYYHSWRNCRMPYRRYPCAFLI